MGCGIPETALEALAPRGPIGEMTGKFGLVFAVLDNLLQLGLNVDRVDRLRSEVTQDSSSFFVLALPDFVSWCLRNKAPETPKREITSTWGVVELVTVAHIPTIKIRPQSN